MIIKILLLFVFFLKCYSSLEIILFIDFSSNVSYVNSECGGSISVIEIDGEFYQNNNITYPPCKGTLDTGIRARQFISNTISNPYRNTSLIVYFKNYTPPTAIFISSGFGIISSFCFFDIRVYNEPNSIIIIDGQNSANPLFQYQIISNASINGICDPNKPRMKLKNFSFINFLNTRCLYIYTLNQFIEKPYPIIELSSITTTNSNSFIRFGFDQNVYAPLEIIIKDCTFLNSVNLKNQKVPMIWNWYNILTIDNCIFNNFINISPLVVSNYCYNTTTIKNTRISNVAMAENVAMVVNYNSIDIFDNVTIENCQFYGFSVSFYKNNNYGVIFRLSNIIFKYCNILYSTVNPNISYSSGVFTFLGSVAVASSNNQSNDTFGIYFNNVTFDSSNTVSSLKDIMFVVNMIFVHFTNFNILTNGGGDGGNMPSVFQTSMFTDLTPVNIFVDTLSISLFTNSVQFCESSLKSLITIQLNKQQRQLPKLSEIYIKQPCSLCTINYILLNDFENSSSSSSISSSSSSSNNSSSGSGSSTSISSSGSTTNISSSSNHTTYIGIDSEDSGTSGFNKILLIPIIISPIVVISLIISISFCIKRRKRSTKEKGSNEEEIGEGTIEKNMNIVGEIMLQEFAVSE